MVSRGGTPGARKRARSERKKAIERGKKPGNRPFKDPFKLRGQDRLELAQHRGKDTASGAPGRFGKAGETIGGKDVEGQFLYKADLDRKEAERLAKKNLDIEAEKVRLQKERNKNKLSEKGDVEGDVEGFEVRENIPQGMEVGEVRGKPGFTEEEIIRQEEIAAEEERMGERGFGERVLDVDPRLGDQLGFYLPVGGGPAVKEGLKGAAKFGGLKVHRRGLNDEMFEVLKEGKNTRANQLNIIAKNEKKIIAEKIGKVEDALKETKRLKKTQEGIDIYKLTPDQAESWADDVMKLSKNPNKLLGKMKKFVFSKKGFWTATVSTAFFFGAAGYQWGAYWGAADNLSGTASQDSGTLMETIKFGIKNEETGEKIFMTAEDIEKRKAEIMMKQNAAETTMRYARWINPVTGYPLSKFYGAMARGNRETIEFNFGLIDQMKGQV